MPEAVFEMGKTPSFSTPTSTKAKVRVTWDTTPGLVPGNMGEGINGNESEIMKYHQYSSVTSAQGWISRKRKVRCANAANAACFTACCTLRGQIAASLHRSKTSKQRHKCQEGTRYSLANMQLAPAFKKLNRIIHRDCRINSTTSVRINQYLPPNGFKNVHLIQTSCPTKHQVSNSVWKASQPQPSTQPPPVTAYPSPQKKNAKKSAHLPSLDCKVGHLAELDCQLLWISDCFPATANQT